MERKASAGRTGNAGRTVDVRRGAMMGRQRKFKQVKWRLESKGYKKRGRRRKEQTR